MRTVEILSARQYYRRPTPGWVVVVNGHPTHFHGRIDGVAAKSRAHAFALVERGQGQEPRNGLGKPVVGLAAHTRMVAAEVAMKAAQAAYADACTAYHRECSIERAIAEHGEALIGCMVAHHAKDSSDAEIERTLADCVCGPMLVALAKEMRARGLLDGLPGN